MHTNTQYDTIQYAVLIKKYSASERQLLQNQNNTFVGGYSVVGYNHHHHHHHHQPKRLAIVLL